MNTNFKKKQLNSFDADQRKREFEEVLKETDVVKTPLRGNVNLHQHTFFSYNAYDWSPTQIAVANKKNGIEAAGIIDFDVLDGMSEFYHACDQLGLKSSVGIETRTFNSAMTDLEIDSPGEPGVSYVAGTGFTSLPLEKSNEAQFLKMLFETSRSRNLALIERINGQLPELAIDYNDHVLPLTPSGNATERHIVEAYINQSKKRLGDRFAVVWAEVLEKSVSEIEELTESKPVFDELVRKRLAKQGGIGYQRPSQDTFPSTKETFNWIRECGAIPTESWLDGTSAGEKDPERLVEMSYSLGARALNIIPDRNWNIKVEALQKQKVQNLEAIVKTANNFGLPLHIGTEMNKIGQPFVDDLNGAVLSRFKKDFKKGAHIITGHVVLRRFADFGYLGGSSLSEFKDITTKNSFFEAVGQLPALSPDQQNKLKQSTNEEAFSMIADSAKKLKWTF